MIIRYHLVKHPCLHRRHRGFQAVFSFLILAVLLAGLLAPAGQAAARVADLAGAADSLTRRSVAPVAPNAPALAVTKTLVSPAGRTTLFAGETAVFELQVENTGSTTVAYLPQLDEFGTNCLEFLPKADPPESDYSNLVGYVDWEDLTVANGVDLAPGEVFVTQVSFLVKAPGSGNLEPGFNTVRVSGALDVNGAPVPPAEDTFEFVCARQPTLAVDKSFLTPQNRIVLLTGETVQFQVVVTNTGATTLAYIPLLDQFDTTCLEFVPKASPPESIEAPGYIGWEDLTVSNSADLLPGQAFTTTITFQVVGPPAPAVTASGVNTATVSGALDVNGYPASPGQDSVQYTCAAPASIGDYVWLDANGNGLQDEGPGAGLNGVTVYLYLDDGDSVFEPGSDDILVATQVTSGDGGYLFGMLHAGDYWVDVDDATLPPGLVLTSGTDPLLVTVNYGDTYLNADFGYSGADLSVVKTDGLDLVAVGMVLTYTLTVNNAGPSAALNVIVTDTLPAGLVFVAAAPPQAAGPNPLIWNLGTIPAQGSTTIVVTTTVGSEVGNAIINLAQVGSETPDPRPADNADTEPTHIIRPEVRVEKTANPPLIHSGDSVTYTYVVTNPGDVPLATVTVTDDRCSPVTPVTSGGFNVGDTDQNNLLEPGEAWQFTCTTTLSVDTVNTALATGQPTDPTGQPLPGIGPVQDDDIALVDVINPGINVVKTGPTVSFVGATVTFTYTVTNAGDTLLANVTVTDDVCGSATYVSGDVNYDGLLGLAETWTFTCTYTIQDTDPDPLVNVATATGQDALGLQVEDQDTWQTDLITVSFGNFVWLDANGDGVQQPGETTGFTGVPIHVTGVDVLGNTVNFTVTTTAGYYLVTGLLPGTYTATVPSTFNAYVLSTPASITFTLTETSPQRLDIDFGYSYPTAVVLMNFEVWPVAATVELRWEMSLAGGGPAPAFHVWRSVPGSAWQRLTSEPVTANSFNGVIYTYAYTDATAQRGATYLYRLEALDGATYGPRQVTVPDIQRVFLPLVVR